MTSIERSELLTVPRDPKLLLPSYDKWASLSAKRKADLSLPTTPTPFTDSETIEKATAGPKLRGAGYDADRARWKLTEQGVTYDVDQRKWIWGIRRRGTPAASPNYYYMYRSLVEIVATDELRLLGCMTTAAMAIDNAIMLEVDPEQYLDHVRNGQARGLAVAGTDPETGATRVDNGSVEAIRHYFGL